MSHKDNRILDVSRQHDTPGFATHNNHLVLDLALQPYRKVTTMLGYAVLVAGPEEAADHVGIISVPVN